MGVAPTGCMAAMRRRFSAFGRTGRRDWLWRVVLAGIAIIVVLFVTFAVIGRSVGGPTIASIPCETGERLQYHVHTRLTIVIEGRKREVPSEIGIRSGCLYWLHTHDTSGVIHVEAPRKQPFTLGQFFGIWGEPLSQTTLLDRQADSQHYIRATLDGVLWQGSPTDIPLEDGGQITLEYTNR